MRLCTTVLGVALLANCAGLAAVARSKPSTRPATRIQAATMTDTQVRQKLESEGYTNVRIRERGKTYVEVTAAKDGKTEKLALNPQSDQVIPERDDDND